MELKRKFSEEFKDLVNKLLSFKAEERPSINQIRTHNWFNGSEMFYEEVKEEMEKRHSKFKQ
jgi:serine/threonine protein kinase